MTNQEFSNAFDTILNSYHNQALFGETTSRADISVDEYEKSIFLTQAQDLIIKLYFERTSLNVGFDESERRQVDFSSLITVSNPSIYRGKFSTDSRDILGTYNTFKSPLEYNSKLDKIVLDIFSKPLYATVPGVFISEENTTLKILIYIGESPLLTMRSIFDTNYIQTGLNKLKSEYNIILLNTDSNADNYLGLFASDITARLFILGHGTEYHEIFTSERITDKYDDRGILYQMPTTKANTQKILFVLNEKLKVTRKDTGNAKTYVIKPISFREYDRLMSKAYTQPLKKQCWRLFQGDEVDIVSEIIPIAGVAKDSILEYTIRYVRRPRPIVLVDLEADGLSVDGESKETSCELNPILHMDILNKAVELVLATRGGRSSQPTSNQQ